MPKALSIVAEKAKNVTDVGVGNRAPERRLTHLVMQKARGIWPFKVAANLALTAKVEQRTAERWLSGEQQLSAEALANLIRSEDGLTFLSAVMADARPTWWGFVRSASRLGLLRYQQQKLKEAVHEAEQIDETLARAETAMGNVDPDFFSQQIDASRSVRGNADRTLAQKGRPR